MLKTSTVILWHFYGIAVSLKPRNTTRIHIPLGKTLFWARKNWTQTCQEPNLQQPPSSGFDHRKAATVFFSTLEKFLIFSLDSKPPPPSLLTAVWLFLLGWGARVVWIAVNSWNKWSAGVFKLCDKCDVFSWFRGDTHWRRPRFASIHFSPTRRERWSQMPAMQLGRKTLSRCLLQRGRHKDQWRPAWKLMGGAETYVWRNFWFSL